jgi:D-lactate dehydrogenase (cytochrome)
MIIKKDKDTINNYFEDSSGMTGAHAEFVAIAQNEGEIAEFLIEMSGSTTPVTVVGALTANTGAGLAYGGAVLSLEKINFIGEICESGDFARVKVGAGARLSDIKKKVFDAGWMYAPDPTEQNSTIGGNISTNASGARSFKFGSTRDYILSIKIVFSDGAMAVIRRGECFADDEGRLAFKTDKGIKNIVLPTYKLPKIKNAAGYFNYPNADLIDVFIGSEGTLGVIVEAELLLIKRFRDVFGFIVFFESQDGVFEFVRKAKGNGNGILVSGLPCGRSPRTQMTAMSIEYFDLNTLEFVRDSYPSIPQKARGAVMIEQDVYEGDDEDEMVEKWVELINEVGVSESDVWFAQDLGELERFRVFRHKIPEKANEIVHKTKIPKVGTDFAVGDDKIEEIIEFCHKEFEKSGLLNLIFGHIGQNHLHANIIAKTQEEFVATRKIYEKIVQKAIDFGGTASAEHGIGKIRHIFLEKMVKKEGLRQMAKLKKSLDNSGILGIDNIFPQEYL